MGVQGEGLQAGHGFYEERHCNEIRLWISSL